MRVTFSSIVLTAAFVASAQQQADRQARFDSLIEAGDYAAVRPELESWVSAHPQYWQQQYQLGYVYFRLRLIQPSVAALCKSLTLHPDFAESHKILAYDLNILGHQDLALRELQIAIRQNPDSSESYYEIGRIYYERGSYSNAVQSLERSKMLNPDFIRVYHNLGLAYSAIRENEKAEANFEEGLRRNAKVPHPSAWPLIDYATYFNLQANFERARDLLLQSLAFETNWDAAYGELSKAYRGLGMRSEAIDALRHAIALNSAKPEYHYVLARLLTQAHRTEEANAQLALYEQARQNPIH